MPKFEMMVTELESYLKVGYEEDKSTRYKQIVLQLAMQGFDVPRAFDCMEVDDVKINLKEIPSTAWKTILKTAIENRAK